MPESSLKWLDPEDMQAVPDSAVISRAQVDLFTESLLGDALVAQRLVSVPKLQLEESETLAKDQVKKWGDTFSSLVAILASNSLATGSAESRRNTRRFQEQLLRAQAVWPDLASVSDRAFLVCQDNKPPQFGLARRLYPTQSLDGVLGQSGFGQLIEELIRLVSPATRPAWISTSSGLREGLATILSETFKNTHDHARHDIDNSDVVPSIRGVFARFCDLRKIDELAPEGELGTLNPAQRFARHFLPPKNEQSRKWTNEPLVEGLLELSVFDSGPGMAAKWLKRSVAGVSIDEQLDAVMACFAKGQTSTDTQGRGFGLAKVLSRLRDLRGFVSVRTNQVHLYRQFASLPGLAHRELSDGTRIPREVLFDWKRPLAPLASVMPDVRGTVVTVLLPMGEQ